MSERNCVMHGALEVSWYTEDVPDLDGEPRCYVCELEKRAETAEQLNKEMYDALKLILDSTERIRENACSCGIGEMCHTCRSASIARAVLLKAEGKL